MLVGCHAVLKLKITNKMMTEKRFIGGSKLYKFSPCEMVTQDEIDNLKIRFAPSTCDSMQDWDVSNQSDSSLLDIFINLLYASIFENEY